VRYQKKIYQGVPLLFGLRSYKEADTVRLSWASGFGSKRDEAAGGEGREL